MAGGLRSSARLSEKSNLSPPSATKTGTKRKVDEQSSPASAKSKRGRKPKEQKTIEETLKPEDDVNGAVDMGVKAPEADQKLKQNVDAHETEDSQPGRHSEEQNGHANGNESSKLDDETREQKGREDEQKVQPQVEKSRGEVDTSEGAVEKDEQREAAQPSNILEKGIIYFFTKGRVDTDNPDSVQDLARSYFVLRPLPAGAKLTDGAIQDIGNNRLIALPKKVWPKSGKDRFMCFVDKAKTDMKTLKEDFFQGSDYSTQTVGNRRTPAVTPVGEGVYAITTTGGGQGTSHLAYMLTIPDKVGEVQDDMGIKERGSFALSVKNPESSAPNNALPNAAEYPREFIEEFAGRGWLAAQPKHLDYDNASILLIGEGDFDKSSNLDPAPKDERDDTKETPQEELEKLESEDEHRVEGLKGDDTIFADLGISAKEYPKVMTSW